MEQSFQEEGSGRNCWRQVCRMLTNTLCVCAPCAVRLLRQTLRVTTIGRMACLARKLVASRPVEKS